MLQFVCDYCGNIKELVETWINGMAAENVGMQAARREVVIDPVWRHERVVQPFAVHFCSIDCKDSYLAELFDKPPSLLEVKSVRPEPKNGTRVVRAKKKPATASVPKGITSRKRRLR